MNLHLVSSFRNLFIEWQNTSGKVYFLPNQHMYTLCSIRKIFVTFKLPNSFTKFLFRSGSRTVYRVLTHQVLSEYLAGTAPGYSGRQNTGGRAPGRQVLKTGSAGLGLPSLTKSIQAKLGLLAFFLCTSAALIPAEYPLHRHSTNCSLPFLETRSRPSLLDLCWGICGLLS